MPYLNITEVESALTVAASAPFTIPVCPFSPTSTCAESPAAPGVTSPPTD